MLKVEWASSSHATRKHSRDIAKTCSHAVSARADEMKLETSRGVHWQRWTPCVRACYFLTVLRPPSPGSTCTLTISTAWTCEYTTHLCSLISAIQYMRSQSHVDLHVWLLSGDQYQSWIPIGLLLFIVKALPVSSAARKQGLSGGLGISRLSGVHSRTDISDLMIKTQLCQKWPKGNFNANVWFVYRQIKGNFCWHQCFRHFQLEVEKTATFSAVS